ncbi:MAG: glutathione S-transferase [Granulosicoccus sp.]|jgi:glutathione S-transferase
MYELYAYPNTYAIGVHLLLQEFGVDYRVIDVSEFGARGEESHSYENSDSVSFKQISPHRRVPALRLADGSSQFESGAIALHLADSLCDGEFSIAADSASRPEYLQWLFYLSSTLQPEIMLQFHPEHYFDDTSTQQALKAASMRRLSKIWPVLETRYAAGPWMFEDRPTAVDFSLATVLFWKQCFQPNVSIYPNLLRTLQAIEKREACAEVLCWHRREISQTGKPARTTTSQHK